MRVQFGSVSTHPQASDVTIVTDMTNDFLLLLVPCYDQLTNRTNANCTTLDLHRITLFTKQYRYTSYAQTVPSPDLFTSLATCITLVITNQFHSR